VRRSLALPGGAGSVEEVLREGLLSAVAETSSAGRGGAGRSGIGKGAGALLVSAAVLLSINAAKLSFGCDGSGRTGFCGAV